MDAYSRLFAWFWLWLFPRIGLEKRLAGLRATEFAAAVGKHQVRKINISGIPVFSLFSYKNELVREAIWLLKYHGSREAARIFGGCLHDKIVVMTGEDGFMSPLLVPLPLSKKRRKQRGWNQTEMIVDEIIKKNALKKMPAGQFLDSNYTVLIKTRHTPPQTRLSRRERLENLKDCFAVTDPELIKGRTIILIDDVTTTGATIAEAAMTLRKAGAGRVMAWTVAR